MQIDKIKFNAEYRIGNKPTKTIKIVEQSCSKHGTNGYQINQNSLYNVI